jgi:hypothetical protein
MFFQGVAEEGGEVVTSLTLVLVVLLGFDRRGARRSARGVGAVRWIRVSLLGTPDGLDVRKKVRSVSSSRSSRIWSYAVRRARLLEDLKVARMTDLKTSSMVSAPMYSKALRISPTLPKWVLTAFLESREIGQKSFPYLLSAQKLGRAVLVKNGVGVGKLGPQRHKTAVYGVFKKIAFMFVHRHP